MGNEGWVCPRCGKVNAPWMPQCSCSQQPMTVTCVDNETTNITATTQKFETTATNNDVQMICS